MAVTSYKSVAWLKDEAALRQPVACSAAWRCCLLTLSSYEVLMPSFMLVSLFQKKCCFSPHSLAVRVSVWLWTTVSVIGRILTSKATYQPEARGSIMRPDDRLCSISKPLCKVQLVLFSHNWPPLWTHLHSQLLHDWPCATDPHVNWSKSIRHTLLLFSMRFEFNLFLFLFFPEEFSCPANPDDNDEVMTFGQLASSGQ